MVATVLLLALVAIASITDLLWHKIYNWTTYSGIVATSDSVILDSALRVCDLPRMVLEECFRFTPPALPDFPGPFPSGPGQSSGSENPGS